MKKGAIGVALMRGKKGKVHIYLSGAPQIRSCWAIAQSKQSSPTPRSDADCCYGVDT